MIRLFIYGTLKRGYCNTHHMAGCVFRGEVRTARQWDMCALTPSGYAPFPGLITGTHHIAGELYDVPEDKIDALDAFECARHCDTPQDYHRENIILEDGTSAQGYILTDRAAKDAHPAHPFLCYDAGTQTLTWRERSLCDAP